MAGFSGLNFGFIPSVFGGSNGTVTSVGLVMPSAFNVSNSPITTSGDINVSGAGTTSQYIRGDGSLANFPYSTGGGASVSYYLNGGTSQGSFGGITYYQMSKTAVVGSNADFNINADGYVAQFITDSGDPNLLNIPSGNWNFELFFNSSSSGGSPRFYIELYKYNGSAFTLIASNSANPEVITGGTAIDVYLSPLAVPNTTLALTDRLAVRIYVITDGRTVTLHTQDSHLCQVVTTFTTGLTALNGLTAQVQNFATGTSGTDFNIVSSGSTHTFNIPDASATNRGLITTGTQTIEGQKSFNQVANFLNQILIGYKNGYTQYSNGLNVTADNTAGSTLVKLINGNNGNYVQLEFYNSISGYNYTFPTQSGFFAMSVNGNTAGSNGNVVISNNVTGSGTNNEIAYFNSTGSTVGSLTTATYPSLTELSYVKGVTSAIQTQFTAINDYVTLGQQAMGSVVKTVGLGCRNLNNISAQSGALANNTLYLVAVYLPQSATITGVKWYQSTQGNYTGAGENRIGLYTYSAGVLTLVASSANDGNLWKNAANAFIATPFSSPYSASAGLYFIGGIYMNSAQVTPPQIGCSVSRINAAANFDFTNTSKITAVLSAQASLPSSVTLSATANTAVNYAFFLY